MTPKVRIRVWKTSELWVANGEPYLERKLRCDVAPSPGEYLVLDMLTGPLTAYVVRKGVFLRRVTPAPIEGRLSGCDPEVLDVAMIDLQCVITDGQV
jgi:hypothetical protein